MAHPLGLFVGTSATWSQSDSGGIYCSLDGGKTWRAQFKVQNVLSFAFSPDNDAQGSLFGVSLLTSPILANTSQGLLISADGSGWQATQFPSMTVLSVMDVDGELLIGAEDGVFVYQTVSGLRLLPLPSSKHGFHLAIDFRQWWWAYDEEQLLVSRNFGLEWQNVPTNLPAGVSFCSFAVDDRGASWLGTSKGLCLAVDNHGFERVALPERKVKRLWVIGEDLLAATDYSIFHCIPNQDPVECWNSGSNMLDDLAVKDGKVFGLSNHQVWQIGYFEAKEEDKIL